MLLSHSQQSKINVNDDQSRKHVIKYDNINFKWIHFKTRNLLNESLKTKFCKKNVCFKYESLSKKIWIEQDYNINLNHCFI